MSGMGCSSLNWTNQTAKNLNEAELLLDFNRTVFFFFKKASVHNFALYMPWCQGLLKLLDAY